MSVRVTGFRSSVRPFGAYATARLFVPRVGKARAECVLVNKHRLPDDELPHCYLCPALLTVLPNLDTWVFRFASSTPSACLFRPFGLDSN